MPGWLPKYRHFRGNVALSRKRYSPTILYPTSGGSFQELKRTTGEQSYDQGFKKKAGNTSGVLQGFESQFIAVLVRTLAGLAFALILLQFVRPDLRHPPVTAELQAPSAVRQILQTSCYPCHSNERRLSWFDEIVPIYWAVAHDVKKAREHLNFSELGGRSQAEQRATLFEAVNFIQKEVMPLKSYTRLHPRSRITQAQLDVLHDYLRPKPLPNPSTELIQAADEEYRKWISTPDRPIEVRKSPNGIRFLPDYKNWKLIDSTVRFDADTLRLILGNDVAIKAIADNNTNPWPDGATFAKVGWFQQPDEHGSVRAGAFLKVGFMIKNKAKYASTAGWGWAEWEGIEHRPFGEGPGFATGCVTCHTPQRASDYTFTLPVLFANGRKTVSGTFNRLATLTGDIDVDPLGWKVITCGANPRELTMSTLFGNDIAVQYARTHSEGAYPAGSVLSLVTWHQQEDSQWFGARMPAETKWMELLTVSTDGDAQRSYAYRGYQGSPLKRVTAPQSRADERVAYIRSLRAAVMP